LTVIPPCRAVKLSVLRYWAHRGHSQAVRLFFAAINCRAPALTRPGLPPAAADAQLMRHGACAVILQHCRTISSVRSWTTLPASLTTPRAHIEPHVRSVEDPRSAAHR
jgi:hypothetical protein